MKIKRYKLSDDITREKILKYGTEANVNWVVKDCDILISKSFSLPINDDYFEFDIDIAFKKDIKDWNDFDNILVLDSDFCQPYTPFYGENYGKDIKNFKCLEAVIKDYNSYLDSLPFLVEIK